MARFDAKTLEIIKRLQNARLSLMANQPFYALLLMNLKFALDVSCETAYTDGERIAFNPDFINELDDGELEFVLMHEVLHVVLAHPFRHQSDYEMFEFDIACDIIVNSNILYSFGNDKSKITLKKYGESMHCMPNGDEGYEYSLEEAYQILLAEKYKKNKKQSGGDKGKGYDTTLFRNHEHRPGAKTYAGHSGSLLDEPSKTIKAGAHGVPGGENMVVLDDGSVRYYTVRECSCTVKKQATENNR